MLVNHHLALGLFVTILQILLVFITRLAFLRGPSGQRDNGLDVMNIEANEKRDVFLQLERAVQRRQ